MSVRVSQQLSDILTLIEKIEKSGKNTGAILIFIGIVRGRRGKRKVRGLYYEAHRELAEQKIMEIAEEIKRRYGVEEILVEHRIGNLRVGDKTMQVLIASEHRDEAIAAMEELIDRIKSGIPIWKKEILEDKEYWIKTETPPRIRLMVNGKKIPLNPFVSDLLTRTIIAMISSLKGVNIHGDEKIVIRVYSDSKNSNSSLWQKEHREN